MIISRYHPALYEYVRTRFAGESSVEVILDRRSGQDRRTLSSAAGTERRMSERRTRPQVDVALRMESMQFITIPPTTGGHPRHDVRSDLPS
jgi:hypothetical protein